MKKRLTLMAAVLTVLAATAQVEQRPSEQMMREFRQTVKSRKPMASPLKDEAKIMAAQPAAKGGATAKYRGGLPAGNIWFPGEWEEVQAITLTLSYNYTSTNPSYQGYYYMADPILPGMAAIYQYTTSGWRYANAITDYTATMDTTSEHGQVFFHLIDAVQEGGADAWVRVENEADTAIVLRRLTAMGHRTDRIRFYVAPGNSFWYRDCGPICFYYGDQDSVAQLDFEYYPGRAMDDSVPVYIERHFGLPNYTTSIEWEGGNCLVDGTGMVLSSDQIYVGNADEDGQYFPSGGQIYYHQKRALSQAEVRDSLQRLIGQRATYILPAFQHDGGTGHVDLYADMVDENTFVFSQMPDRYSSWNDYRTGTSNMNTLCSYSNYFDRNYKHVYIPFPSNNSGGYFSSESDYENYTRTYSNHTFVNNLIIQPCFSAVGPDGMPTAQWDSDNIEALKEAYPGYRIYCVDVSTFDGSGGAIHCVTKQIPADNPVRILHPSITGKTYGKYRAADAAIEAVITNRSGIASATLHYQVAGGEWKSIDMQNTNENNWFAYLPTTTFDKSQTIEVRYYISATSNNGKTINKPFTATDGGAYMFTMSATEGIDPVVAEGERFGQFRPNPATDKAEMTIDVDGESLYEVTIHDISGRTVYSGDMQAAGTVVYTVNTSMLEAGMYTVVFTNESNRVVRKLIVR